MTDKCMVVECEQQAAYHVFDGNFWVKNCQPHTSEFESFAKVNGLKFDKKVLS